MISIVWKFIDMEIEECEICPDRSVQFPGARVNEVGMKNRGESPRRLDNALNPVEIWRKVFRNI